MNTELERLEAEALKLPAEERERLVERLLASLDSPAEGDESGPVFATPELERYWIQECRRRIELMGSGEMATYPAEEVIAELQAELQARLSR